MCEYDISNFSSVCIVSSMDEIADNVDIKRKSLYVFFIVALALLDDAVHNVCGIGHWA